MNWYITVLKKYAVFNGRARRKEYWIFFLINTIISWVPIVGLFYSLAVLIPSIAVGVRRMHDTNRSGWWLIVPVANLVFACTEGTRGPNKYGEDPKAEAPVSQPQMGA